MNFREMIQQTVQESAQVQLDLITQISAKLGGASVSALKRVLKMLEGGADVNESAQVQLDLIAQIGKLMGKADISTLKRVLKALESGSDEQI